MNWLQILPNIPLWKKYSQCNEEAYLAEIFKNLGIQESELQIVEIGAWDGYHLSNTRYFIEKGASATLIDGDNRGNKEVKQHFLTVENVCTILETYSTPKEFDLLCIDIDGNDIYIIEAILKNYRPKVIIAEFNPIFEKGISKAIRYNKEHTWQENDYYGFSFSAGVKLGLKQGYSCILQNDSLNMYFINNKILCHNLGVTINELQQHLPEVNFQIKNDHPKAQITDWVDY